MRRKLRRLADVKAYCFSQFERHFSAYAGLLQTARLLKGGDGLEAKMTLELELARVYAEMLQGIGDRELLDQVRERVHELEEVTGERVLARLALGE